MRALAWILTLLLLLLGLGLAALALGAFASLNLAAPLWLRSLGTLGSLALGGGNGFTHAVVLSVLASAVLALAAYLKPRA
ncbi:hypothetical protein [Deinococcus gobiensis]|uniref:hypothetical protein n=1 Tax=Deinococcus gobiensis TaxID=502394 RepID=UPI0002FD8FE6|nr:hypothetical protein [Deinococcus gobiensis]